jgi:hypothetical protein
VTSRASELVGNRFGLLMRMRRSFLVDHHFLSPYGGYHNTLGVETGLPVIRNA